MQPVKYRFYLNDEEIFPTYKSLTKKYGFENGQMFMRPTLEGDLYLYKVPLELNKKYTLVIKTFVNDSWQEYFKGTFSKTDCEIDYDKGRTKIKLSALDEYEDILNNEENTYNLLELPIAVQYVSIDKRPMLQTYIPGSSTVGCFLSNVWFEQECTPVDDESQLVSKYKFGKSPVSYKYIELSADEVGVLQEVLLSTYVGSLEKTMIQVDEFEIKEGLAGKFYSITSPAYYIYAEFVFVSLTSFRTTYKLIFSGNEEVLYQSVTYSGVGGATAPEEDTFTLTPTNPANKPIDGALYTRYIFSRWVCDKEFYDGKATAEIPSDDLCSNNRNYRRCVPWPDKAGIEISTRTSKEPTEWGMADNYEYFLPPTDTVIYYPISRSIWGIVSFWHNANYSMNVVEDELTTTYLMKNAYEMSSCIQALLTKMGTSIKHEGTAEYSEFLYSDTNPVVGEAFRLFLTQKTNILKGEYDQPAQKAETTFKSLMDMLQQCFKCYWFVENGKLRIEHISWFLKGGSYSSDNVIGIDLTNLADLKNLKAMSYGQSSVKYNKDELSSRLEFSWAESCSPAFEGKAIDIDSEYIQKDKKEEISVSDFAADVDFMLLNPSSFSDDGFAILGAVRNGNIWKLPYINFTFYKNNLAYTVKAQNGYMAWSYLELFYLWDMPSSNIKIDGVLKVNNSSQYYVRSVKRSMTQSVKFPYKEDPDLNKLIKTFIGDGKINGLSINMNTRQVEAELLFTPV